LDGDDSGVYDSTDAAAIARCSPRDSLASTSARMSRAATI
jgi:hypothetical protein